MFLKKILRKFPQNTFYVLLNGQSKTIFSIFLISINNIIAANLLAEIILSLGFFMSFTTYDSGRLFYIDLQKEKNKYESILDYILRQITIVFPISVLFFFILIRLNFGFLLTLLILFLFFMEKTFDEYQRFLVSVVNYKNWLILIKRKSLAQFFQIFILILLSLYFDIKSEGIIVMFICTIIIANIFSFLDQYTFQLFKKYKDYILSEFRNLKYKSFINYFFKYMKISGSKGGLMMSLEPIVNSFGSQWLKLLLFSLMPDIKYIINLIYTFSGGIETYFSSESLVVRRKQFITNAMLGKKVPNIKIHEKINVVLLSLLSSFIICFLIKENLILTFNSFDVDIILTLIFIWALALSISSTIKSWELGWMHYKFPGLTTLIISGSAYLISLLIISLNFIFNKNNLYTGIIFSVLLSLILEILIIRSNNLKQKIEIFIKTKI